MSTTEQTTDVVVIGGGVAGLAAARTLADRGLAVTLLEARPAIGGRTTTVTVDGLPIDLGAAFVSDFYHATMRMINEAGLADTLIRRSQTAYVIRDAEPEAIWPAPRLIEEHALPALDKLRLLRLVPALLRHWRRLDIGNLSEIADADRLSAAEFARQSIGTQNTEYFFGPLLRGLLYWDPATTSAAVVWCILKAFANSKATYRFDGGMTKFAHGLVDVPQVDVVCEAEVTDVDRTDAGTYTVRATKGGGVVSVDCRAVICAATADTAARLAGSLPQDMRGFLESVRYSRTAVLTYRVSSTADDYPRGAYLFPTSVVTDLTSINPLYQHIDGEQARDAGSSETRLLNVYLSDRGYGQYEDMDDDELGEQVLERLSALLAGRDWLSGAKLKHVHRWQRAVPRFDVGHIAAVNRFRAIERKASADFLFAGDYLDGPYIDGATRSGVSAATRVLAKLEV